MPAKQNTTSLSLWLVIIRLLSFSRHLNHHWRWAVSLLFLGTVAQVSGPILVKIFIDDYLTVGHYPWLPLVLLTTGYIVLHITGAVAAYFETITFHQIALKVIERIRLETFAKVLDLPLRFFDQTSTAWVISRVSNDTEVIKDLFVHVLASMLKNTVLVIGIFIAMAILDWQLMLIAATILPVTVVCMVTYQRLSAPLFQRVRSLLSDINTRLNESIQGMTLIQVFNQQSRFKHYFSNTALAHYQARLKTVLLDGLMLRAAIDLLAMLVLAGLLFGFGYQALSSVAEIGVIYAFINYVNRFTEPLIEMTQRLNLLQQAIVAADRVFQLLDQPGIITQQLPKTNNTVKEIIHHTHIECNQISFAYELDNTVLDNINLFIPEGTFCAIVGHTGSGKSTLASLLLGLYNPIRGDIKIGGHSLLAINKQVLHQYIGIVQQDPFLFSGTIRDNLSFGIKVDEHDLNMVIKSVGLQETLKQLPNGLETHIGERGLNLSTGQRQLICLARVLLRKPKILILDEATANIDSETEQQVLETLQMLHGKITIIAIAHRLSTVTHVDKIFVLAKGKLVQQGHHFCLLKERGVYRDIYELQQFGDIEV
ncbi:ABC transporter transmembrane domain-containing protein [Zooshikella sp. RANM57]|uniref:ABC transporter transmembrane domain-containing protein n=1 Tax=Zooshikella sp. RANM57 TaxID=3425863 RepID=UPI003D6F46F8